VIHTRSLTSRSGTGPPHGVPLETRKILLGHKNGDITTHYSAPELEELIEAANRVCEGKSGKTPALVVLKHRTLSAVTR